MAQPAPVLSRPTLNLCCGLLAQAAAAWRGGTKELCDKARSSRAKFLFLVSSRVSVSWVDSTETNSLVSFTAEQTSGQIPLQAVIAF